MFKFLAGTARAQLVAADLAPTRRVVRIAFRLCAVAIADQRRCQSGRHLVFACRRIDLVRFHVRKCSSLIGRRRLDDLDAHELGRHRLTQMSHHRFE